MIKLEPVKMAIWSNWSKWSSWPKGLIEIESTLFKQNIGSSLFCGSTASNKEYFTIFPCQILVNILLITDVLPRIRLDLSILL